MTETTLKTTTGIVQRFHDEESLLAYYNRYGRLYEIREGENGLELWHKGHRRIIGVIKTPDVRGNTLPHN